MNDSISREVVISAVKRLSLGETDATRLAMRIGDYLKRVPSAQPERIKGNWIDAVIPNDSGGLPVIVCDKCNTFFPLQFGDGHNFCPNCGADMREEELDETD